RCGSDQHVRAIYEVRVHASGDALRYRLTMYVGIVPELLSRRLVLGEPDNDAVDGSLAGSLGIPGEGAVSELDLPPFAVKRFEQCRDGQPLGDAVRGHVCELSGPCSKKVLGFRVPPRYVVQPAADVLAPRGVQAVGLF